MQRELGQIRAGRANASILDRVMVTYYGVPTPLNQMASITIPEARILMITPFDKTMIQEVEKRSCKATSVSHLLMMVQ